MLQCTGVCCGYCIGADYNVSCGAVSYLLSVRVDIVKLCGFVAFPDR
jgi:hypothetical protein